MSGIDKPKHAICGICGERTLKPIRMCRDCNRAYDSDAQQDGSVMEATSAPTGWTTISGPRR